MKWFFAITLGVCGVACEGGVVGGLGTRYGPEPSSPVPQNVQPVVPVQTSPAVVKTIPAKPVFEMTVEQTRLYLSQVAPFVAGRELTQSELAEIDAKAHLAIEPLVRAWSEDSKLADFARRLINTKFSVNGVAGGIDYNLPGNLAAHITANKLPWSTLLTADYCILSNGTKGDCDSASPFKGGGILNTRAYLTSRASRFNLTRASTMMLAFLCQHYPMDHRIEPPVSKDILLALFASDVAPPDFRDGLGNSSGCYMCHSQFAPHAQLFVKFDEAGKYVADADGLQDPMGEPGRTKRKSLMASHLVATRAGNESSQMLGKQVDNLAQATQLMAKSDRFAYCQVKNVLEATLNFRGITINPEIAEDMSARATQLGTIDPPFGTYVYEVLTEPRVQKAFLTTLGAMQ
jgi:hypothetical protein